MGLETRRRGMGRKGSHNPGNTPHDSMSSTAIAPLGEKVNASKGKEL